MRFALFKMIMNVMLESNELINGGEAQTTQLQYCKRVRSNSSVLLLSPNIQNHWW